MRVARGISALAGLAVVWSLVAGSVVAGDFIRIRKEANFVAHVVGHKLVGEFGTVVMNADGSIDGVPILGKDIGVWEWNKEYWCRTKVAANNSGAVCYRVRRHGDLVEFTRDRDADGSIIVMRH